MLLGLADDDRDGKLTLANYTMLLGVSKSMLAARRSNAWITIAMGLSPRRS